MVKKIKLSVTFVLMLFNLAFAQQTKRPKLVIGLVVDQMRWDYLYRYEARYGKGGFKRLLQEGFSCQNTYINYLPSFTACGHTSIFTGSVPAIHGITGNEWIETDGTKRYCTSDDKVITVGSNTKAGQMSPRALLTTTIGDELKLATNFRSRVIGIALKDRGAILPAGHSADAAYWFDEQSGNWISSSYYLDSLPTWVDNFNREQLPAKYLEGGWQTRYPLESYRQSASDSSIYEGLFGKLSKTTFPYGFVKNDYSKLKTTPFANTLTLEIAKRAVASEELGVDKDTDLLTISLSGTDYIGHHFGPNAVEVEDAYLRLDKDLEAFFTFLDTKVGKGNYLLFLTADHGGAHNPGYLQEKKIPAGYWDAKSLQTKLNNYFFSKYQIQHVVSPFLNYQLFFNQRAIDEAKLDQTKLKMECIELIKKETGIAYVVDLEGEISANIPVHIRERIIQGYHRGRSGVLQIVLQPAWFQLSYDKTGSIHGSWNPYDTHIPLLFMGFGVAKGKLEKQVAITDIAPTIASLLQIQQPNGSLGNVINEVIAN